MNYETARKLKEAGFSQEILGGYIMHTPDCTDWNYPNPCTKESRCYAPTLEELIEACGEDFVGGSVFMKWDRTWGAGNSKQIVSGATPEEAVVNLWLALHPSE